VFIETVPADFEDKSRQNINARLSLSVDAEKITATTENKEEISAKCKNLYLKV